MWDLTGANTHVYDGFELHFYAWMADHSRASLALAKALASPPNESGGTKPQHRRGGSWSLVEARSPTNTVGLSAF